MADCGPIDVTCKVSEGISGVTEDMNEQIKDGVEMFVEATFTGWLNLPVPFIGQDSGLVGFLRDNLADLTGLLLSMAVIVFAGRLIFKHDRDTLRGGAAFAFRTLAVVGGSVTIGSMLIQAADGYSTWIIDQATAGDGLATSILNAFQITGPTGFFVALIFGGVAVFCSIIQGLLLAGRNIMLPILVALAPTVVAVSGTEMGQSWWTKYIAWFTAFVLYKPTAATIYASGFYLLSEGDVLGAENRAEELIAGMNFIYGAMLMVLSIVAFSALMTVITPVSGKLVGGMAGAGIAVASMASLAMSGTIGRAVSGVSAAAAPASVTPMNAAAGAPGGTGSPGTQGTPGPTNTPTPGAAGSAGTQGTPGGHGVRLVNDAAQGVQNGVRNSLNNEENDDR